ncbi:hypothetical protein EV714DRAFT_277959 [Schizophyllum commune]
MVRYLCFARWVPSNTPAHNAGLTVIIVKSGPHAGIYADNFVVPDGAIGQSATNAAEGEHIWEKICMTSHNHTAPPPLNDRDFTVHVWCVWRTQMNNKKGVRKVNFNEAELMEILENLRGETREEQQWLEGLRRARIAAPPIPAAIPAPSPEPAPIPPPQTLGAAYRTQPRPASVDAYSEGGSEGFEENFKPPRSEARTSRPPAASAAKGTKGPRSEASTSQSRPPIAASSSSDEGGSARVQYLATYTTPMRWVPYSTNASKSASSSTSTSKAASSSTYKAASSSTFKASTSSRSKSVAFASDSDSGSHADAPRTHAASPQKASSSGKGKGREVAPSPAPSSSASPSSSREGSRTPSSPTSASSSRTWWRVVADDGSERVYSSFAAERVDELARKGVDSYIARARSKEFE